MESKVLDAVWLNEAGSCTMLHLSEVSGLDTAELQVLVDCGALSPLPDPGGSLAFASSAMMLARTARRLRDDFELNPNGMALAMRLLATVEALECELEELKAGMAGPQHR